MSKLYYKAKLRWLFWRDVLEAFKNLKESLD
jgi:hypothetical protein